MKTFQDFQSFQDKSAFIKAAIQDFKASCFYQRALDSRCYFEGENDILSRLQWFYNSTGCKEVDKFKANNTISNNFYKKIVLQEKNYLLSNGVKLEDDLQGKVEKLDRKVDEATLAALLDGRSFAYAHIGKKGEFKIDIFKGIEFIPLYDERTSDLMAGIRFWQLDAERPTYIELYERDGLTQYVMDKEGIRLTMDKMPYKTIKGRDLVGVRLLGGSNWSELPIVELRADESSKSRLTVSLKSKIDLYDIILSDFGNNLEDSQDVYWVLKNYNGQDMGTFLADYKYYKSIKVDDDGDATPHTIDVPYQARETALKLLREKIYEEAMAVDMSILSGGSLTNVAIRSAFADLDLKVDGLEYYVEDFVDDILELYLEFERGIGTDVSETFSISFIRNRLTDETEIVDNIIKSITNGIMSIETAVKRNPLITDPKEELKLIDGDSMNRFQVRESFTEEVV